MSTSHSNDFNVDDKNKNGVPHISSELICHDHVHQL